jgi:hypothetical protein
MARTKRRTPYDPSKPVHDRRASQSNRGVTNYLVPREVDDPYEAGGKITVMRSTRDDPLGDLHARKMIDEAQYEGGRAFQRDFETAERGPRAIDPSKEFVDGGMLPEPITEAQRKAARQLAVVYRALGQDGSAVVHDVLVHMKTRAQIAESRGLIGERWEKYYGLRFQECLDCLALVYGFATK